MKYWFDQVYFKSIHLITLLNQIFGIFFFLSPSILGILGWYQEFQRWPRYINFRGELYKLDTNDLLKQSTKGTLFE